MKKSFNEVLNENGAFLYKNVGVSMLPFIREGRDFIYIKKRPDERLKKNDVAFFKRPNVKGRGEYVLHRVIKVNADGTYFIIGDNCVSGETVKEENILGVLSAFKRKNKTVKVSDFGYKLYVAYVPIRRFFLIHIRFCLKILRKIYHKFK